MKTKIEIALVAVLVLFAFLVIRGCKPWAGLLGSGLSEIDTQEPAKVEVKPNSVTVTPNKTKANPKPTPISVWKPAEAKVTVSTTDDGKVKVKIRRLGTCFKPKIGVLAYPGEVNWCLGVRLIYWNRFGLAPVANHKAVSPQVDYRLGNFSLGVGPGWTFKGATWIMGSATVFVW